MAFESSAIVELMGHQKIAGKVSEETIAGSAMLRVDVPKTGSRDAFTKFYSATAIYCITPTDEATMVAAVAALDKPPVSPYVVRLPESPRLAERVSSYSYLDDDFDDDDDIDDDEDESDDLPLDAGAPPAPEMPEPETPDVETHNAETSAVVEGDDKSVAAQWAREMLDGEFVIFDTETTGVETTDEIIQIGIIDHTGAVIFESKIKPEQSIQNSQYHGITDDDVKDAPEFKAVYQQIADAMTGKLVLAYNYSYDRRMLEQVCRKHGLEMPVFGGNGCAMEMFAQFHGEWNSYHGNYRWQKLRDALASFGLKHEDFGDAEHDAVTDAKATLAVIKKMAEFGSEAQDKIA